MDWTLISAPMSLAAELSFGWIIAVVTLLTACVPAGVAIRALLETLGEQRARRRVLRARPRVVVRLTAVRHL